MKLRRKSAGVSARRRKKPEPYMQIEEGVWIGPAMSGFIHQCCHCALNHVTDYAIENGRVQFKLRIDRRRTAASRRAFLKGKS